MIDLHQIQVREVFGVGTRKEEQLSLLGIQSVGDLIEYYPYRYEDYRIRDLADAADGEKITVQGKIYGEPLLHMFGAKKSRITTKIMVDRFFITAVWFNRHYIKEHLVPGKEIVITGKWEQKQQRITVSESEFVGAVQPKSGTLQPVYSIAGAITQKWLRNVIKQALIQFGEMIEEIMPQEFMDKRSLMSRKHTIIAIHHPEMIERGSQARKRLVYEELFLFQLKLHAFRTLSHNKADGVSHQIESEDVRAFVRALPFKLTESQKKVIAELLQDMREPYCMNRLLQGDVGSGKTVVAAVALYAAVKAGYQGALMVPTEILAEQHLRSFTLMFERYGIQVGILTGSLPDRQRREILASLQMGMLDIVIGTHALIQEDVFFRSLGIVVIDEQHRFGVNQRSILRRKGLNPDVLTMTATPIPRTLAITAFGDMDVSSLRELPQGRKPIQTYWVKHERLERVLAFIRREMEEGRQAYVICPLIEESDKLDVQNAIDVHAQFRHYFANWRVGLLHGRLPSQEKEQVMREFANNEIQILVTTTVIEVGVDVPNATVMIVNDADRFGLSQLHQLRGRVGRGEHQSHCVLIADPKSEVGQERMRVLTETNDGFEVARRDMDLRGPGDFFGTKQSGLPDFHIADMVTDFGVLEEARDDAAELVRREEFWTAAVYAPLRQFLHRELIYQTESLN